MSNTALRKIYSMLVEKLARIEIFYENKIQKQENVNKKFITSCQDNLKEIKQELSTVYPVLKKTYEETPISREEIDRAIATYKKCLDKFLELHSLSSHLPLDPIASETYIFLSDVLKIKKTFKEFDSRIVLLTQDFLTRNTHQCYTNLPFVSDIEKKPMALYLPIIENCNPLYWPILLKNIFGNIEILKASTKKYYEELIAPKVERDSERRKVTEKLAYQLTYDLFSMKLLGPAYYYLFVELGVFRSIAESKIRYLPTLSIRERYLYKKLEKENLDSKTQSTHDWFLTLSGLSDEMHSTLGFKIDISDIKDGIDELVKRVEEEANKVVSENNAYKCNDFCVSLAGYERLKKGILIASSTVEELNKCKEYCKEKVCSTNINEKSSKMQEIPNTPQQIINSGWMYSESLSDDIMYELIKNENLDYSPMINHIRSTDTLLLNSVEKSRIFEILLNITE